MPRLSKRSLLAVAVVFAAAFASGNAANPLEQVVTMLQGMLKDCETNAKTEEVDMVEKEGQCQNNVGALEKSISTDTKEVSKQEAAKDKAEAEAETLAEEIAKLQARITKNEKAVTKATESRNKEKADHVSMIVELDESIMALKNATAKIAAAQPNITSLSQVLSSNMVSTHDKAVVESFVALNSEPLVPGAEPKPKGWLGETKAYESQTGSVLTLMEKLLAKFQKQKATAETEDRNSGFAFDKLVQQLNQTVKADGDEQKSKEADMASAKEKAAEAEGLLKKAEESLEQGKVSLADLKQSCKLELEEFKKNLEIRAEETKAVETAISVLGEVGVKEPESWEMSTMPVEATALVQVRRSLADPQGDLRKHVASFAQERAAALNSRSLALVAMRVAQDPLGAAKRMIKDLVIKMVSDAEVDLEEKAYCEKELKLNKLSRSDSQDAVEDLVSQLEGEEAAVVTLSSQITEKSDELTELMKSLKEAAELRQKTKDDNIATIKDAKQSQLAVEKAIKVLKDFYAKPDGVALLQSEETAGQSSPPDVVSEEMAGQSSPPDAVSEEMAGQSSPPYAGHDASTKILELLETVLSDFSKLEAETDLDEQQAQSDYETFEAKTEETIAVSEEEKEFKVQKKESTMQNIQSLQKELKNAQEKLDAGLAYFEKLKPTCVDNADWKARVDARSEEIKALQKALYMLGDDYVEPAPGNATALGNATDPAILNATAPQS